MRHTTFAALALSTCLLPGTASAAVFPTELLQSHLGTAPRINLVIMGDGYRAEDQALLSQRATAATNAIFAQSPFSAYRDYFNVKLVHTVSTSDGAIFGNKTPSPSTIFASHFDSPEPTARNLSVGDEGAVANVLMDNAPEFDSGFDIALVLVNDTKYGGSGGQYPTASADPAALDIVIHEIGHSFGKLADEYDHDAAMDSPFFCSPHPSTDWPYPNVTAFLGNPPKWDIWIDDKALRMPLASDDLSHGNAVGMFMGGYCGYGYRPTSGCRMRTLDKPFCPVCSEAIVQSIYQKTGIGSFEPTSPSISLGQGATQSFTYSGPTPSPNTLATTWTVDGRVIAVGAQFTLSSSNLSVGSHTIMASVSDRTSLVRSDPEGRLQATHNWSVVVAGAPACTVQSATDLGAFSSQVTVPSNACVKVSAYPGWWGTRTLNLQAGSGPYPLAATWSDSCSNTTGQVNYPYPWQTNTTGSHASGCPTVIQLKGNGSPVGLSWW